MLSSPGSSHTARFFGLDLGSLSRDIFTAWRGMLEWRMFSWLWPKLAVRLWLPDGGKALAQSLTAPPLHGEAAAQSARFEAIVLPQELLLRRSMVMPALQPAELQAALSLEVQALSPFTSEETVWAYEAVPSDAATLKVDLILTARKLVNQHQDTLRPLLTSPAPEAWIPRVDGPGFILLPGFGDARRQRQGVLWRWVSALLVLLALALTVAIAVTPSAQLYLRALQANQAMLALAQQAGPVIAQRDTLFRLTEQLDNLAKLIGKPVSTLQVLTLITQTLPDDTSLLNLKIQGDKVTLTGQTPNASVLMKQLGSTAGLKDVKAPVPATKPLGASTESFVIEFILDPVQVGAAQ